MKLFTELTELTQATTLDMYDDLLSITKIEYILCSSGRFNQRLVSKPRHGRKHSTLCLRELRLWHTRNLKPRNG